MYLVHFLKHQFDTWRGIALISWAGELFFSFGWQSSRECVLIKTLVPITVLNYPRDFWKYQFDAWPSTISISRPGESPRNVALIKILVPITLLGWHQEGRALIKFCHTLWNDKKYWLRELYKQDWNYLKWKCWVQ